MFRYIAVAWDPRDELQARASERVAERISGRLPEMMEAFSCAGLNVLCAGAQTGAHESRPLPDGGGVILGKLFPVEFDAGSTPKPVTLTRHEADKIVSSGGQFLAERYWGRYVAVLATRPGVVATVLRDPSGGLQCFLTRYQGVHIVFSSMEDCVALNLMRFTVNWRYVWAGLRQRQRQSAETGLSEVFAIRQGERVQLRPAAQVERSLAWDFKRVVDSDRIEDVTQACSAVREKLIACVSAWASCYPHVVHRFSGGLDSSIVLACLAKAPSRPAITCLSYFDPPRRPGERAFVEKAFKACASQTTTECHLIEQQRRFDNLETLRDARIPNVAYHPSYTGWLIRAPIDGALAKARGAALFDGIYGDQLFFTWPHLSAIDQAWDRPVSRSILQVAAKLADAEGQSRSKVLLQSIWNGTLRRYRFQQPASRWPALMKSDFATAYSSIADEEYDSFWCQQSLSTLAPGKRHHIAQLCTPANVYNPFENPSQPDEIVPLASQPLIELFLRIPTYVLTAGGIDRALARRAFQAELPPELHAPRSLPAEMASASDYNERLFLGNADVIRDLLLDGVLAREGLLDRQAAEACLSSLPAQSQYVDGTRELLSTYLDIELWLRSWSHGYWRDSDVSRVPDHQAGSEAPLR